MSLREVGSVLNFSAFRPEPDDPSAAWKKRFPTQKTLLLNVGRSSLSWRAVNKNGTFGEEGSLQGDLKDVLAEASVQLKDLAEDGWCSVSLSTRYVMSLETNLSRRPGSEEIIKSNPRSVLGAKYERGKRYAVTHNPDTNASILISLEEESIRKVESAFKDGGLRIGRICCGAYVLLRHALSITNGAQNGNKPVSYFYIICSMGAVCALVQDQDRWLELRSRTDVYEDSMDPVIDLLQPFKQKIAGTSEIVLLADREYPELAEKIGTLFAGQKVNDFSGPNFLWHLMIQN